MGATESRSTRPPSADSRMTPAARQTAFASPDGPTSEYWRRHIVEVMPNLWLGSDKAACQLAILRNAGIRACVNCTPQPHLHPSHFAYHHIPVGDSPDVDILKHLPAALSWVQQHMAAGRPVLVYCHAGVSRSPTIILGMLLHLRTNMTLMQAWTHLKRLRPVIRPNDGFLEQLQKYEREVHGVCTAVVCRHGLSPATAQPSAAIKSHRTI